MPTGYTNAVEDGTITTLQDYALRCARAFSPLMQMRDEPLDAPIPDTLVPSRNSQLRLENAVKDLAALIAMSETECATAADTYNEDRAKAHTAAVLNAHERAENYQYMSKLVDQWKVPPELKELKQFMITQLEISSPSISELYQEEPAKLTTYEWFQQQLAERTRSRNYYAGVVDKERENVERSNAWLAQLRKALETT